MQHTSTLAMLSSAILTALLSSPIQAQSARTVRKEPSQTELDAAWTRGCPRPTDAKPAQVLTFDKGSLETKLAVSMGQGEFKVVTIRV